MPDNQFLICFKITPAAIRAVIEPWPEALWLERRREMLQELVTAIKGQGLFTGAVDFIDPLTQIPLTAFVAFNRQRLTARIGLPFEAGRLARLAKCPNSTKRNSRRA